MYKENFVFNCICDILKENFEKENVVLNSVLATGDNGLDLGSLDIVDLIIKTEEKFNIIIDFDVLFITIDDVVKEVTKLLNQKNL